MARKASTAVPKSRVSPAATKQMAMALITESTLGRALRIAATLSLSPRGGEGRGEG